MKYKDFLRYGGGRVVYLFHVAGYPWVLTSGAFSTTSYANLKKLILGSRETGTTANPYDEIEYVHGALQAPSRIKYTLDDNTGLIDGGRYTLKVHRKWTGIDWTAWGFPAAYSGLPGLDFIPELGSSGSFGWGYLDGSLAKDDETISYVDQNYNVLSDRVANEDTGYVWIGNECIQVDGVSTSGQNKVLTVRNESGKDNGRGCFRSKAQSHRSEEYTGATPIVSSVPIGSIAGKACYLWATVVDDNHQVILDEGAFCVSHGRVQPHVKIGDGEIDIPIEPWLNHLKQDIPIATFSTSMAGYVFTRGPELDSADAYWGGSYIDGSWYSYIHPQGNRNMRPASSVPHLMIAIWDSELASPADRYRYFGVWLCAPGETVFFRTAEDVIMALKKELQLCNTGDPAQNSGSIAVDGGAYQDLDFSTISAENYRIEKSTSQPNRWIIKHELNTGFGINKTKFAGPLALLFDLCNFRESDMASIKEGLTTGHPIDTFGYELLPDMWGVAGNADLEYLGLNSEPAQAFAPLEGGITPYFYQNYKGSSRVEDAFGEEEVTDVRVSAWPIPVVDTNPRIFLQEDTDMSQLDSTGDFLQWGSYKDEDLDSGKAARTFTGNVTGTGEYQGLPYLEFDATTDYKWDYLDAENPALVSNDPNRPYICRVHHALYWMPGLSPESDPWRVTSKEVTVLSTSITELFQTLLGFETGDDISMPDIGRIDWLPDINDPDCIDEIPSIDWDSFETAMQPLVSGHYYLTTLETGKVNVYEMLKGELQLHGVTMVLEPYTSGTGGNWIIRFKKKNEINTTHAQSEGRVIDSTNIVTNDAQKTEHNKSWRFSQIEARANRQGDDYRFNFSASSQYARARIGGTTVQKIDAGLSHFPRGFATDSSSTGSADLHAHFVPLLVRASKDKPIISKRLTSKSLFYINLGRDALLTDTVTYNINTGARGLDMAPCRVVGVEHVLGDRDYGVNVDLAMGTNATTTYGYAPAMRVLPAFTDVTSEGASGTVTIIPIAHSFTPADGRTDLSYFRNQIWNVSVGDYEVSSPDPAYNVLVMSEDDPDWTPVQGTISGMNASSTSAVLTVDTSNFTIDADKITETLWIKFDTWDNVAEPQKRFLCLANANNKIGLTTIAAAETDLGTVISGA